MIKRYDTSQQAMVDASLVRRYDSTQQAWVDAQFVKRYDSNLGAWVDALVKDVGEQEFYNIGYSIKADYIANGSTANVIFYGEDEYCRIGLGYLDSAGVVFENPVLRGIVTSSEFPNGEHIGNTNMADHYLSSTISETEYIYNGIEFEASFNGGARLIEVVIHSSDKTYASFQLSNFTLNGVPIKFT